MPFAGGGVCGIVRATTAATIPTAAPQNKGIFVISPYPRLMEKILKGHDWEVELKFNLRYVMLKIR